MIDFSKLINAERKKRKMSVEDFARAAGISVATGYRLNQGKPVESGTLEKILNSLGAEIKFKEAKK